MTRLQFIVKTVASSNEWSAAREFGCFVTSLVRSPTLRRNWSFGEVVLMGSQRRFMTTSKRVQDRSKNKRVHDLEIATEKHKVVSKVLVLMEMLKKEPEMIIPVRSLDRHRRQINLPKPHSIVDFIQKSPKLFELYKDQKGVLWCGMTKEAEDLLEEEERLIREHSGTAAEYVTRMLMMSVNKRLPLDKIAHFRREFGLPADFRSKWVHEYPQHFKVVNSPDEVDYLELVEWNPAWAITELEKAILGVSESASHTPGLLSLSFPLKFPASYKKVYRYGGSIEHFQKRSYLSPYADARGLQAGSKEFDKRAIAVMHELLSFTMEKRLVTDHLTHFRREFVMPQKLMRLLLKHLGVFYVSERGNRFSVFLTGAYEGAELIQKCPLVLWKEKVLSLIGYRGRKKKIETFTDISDMEDNDFLEGNSEDEGIPMQLDQQEAISELEDTAVGDSSFMDIYEINNEYKPHDSF
ncbi:protein WHAT'S THIS FACTOR 1 homolog, chloroplastic-like isoform X1 [Syzygium oleosum]|uniref:protein WHAT'S THIS FACTOR 1 homolog, chloroplastic-like isoform X1 n=2 Tax=Syzygium oleosum TaxID=219896 RepID=UPI0011D233DA|nr:protein WHAT'S THIS FACTOR 1 homolog, chloroplastic-like isoform X1 [Syzygium oleosum]XP_056175018.1 protein WHAT'S THIS FACTOR 1 homolog, chloroplastic-like isoform X1 [Syzygium oleosum]XP_056175019.1 protein WHAT'S THIS FACTOR 1 homolog, chloroplastic-like isoform X1 [Syzygium oleosum]